LRFAGRRLAKLFTVRRTAHLRGKKAVGGAKQREGKTVIDCPFTFAGSVVHAFRLMVSGTRTVLHHLLKNQRASVTGNFAVVVFAMAKRDKRIASIRRKYYRVKSIDEARLRESYKAVSSSKTLTIAIGAK
jgi:hypothetical protein